MLICPTHGIIPEEHVLISTYWVGPIHKLCATCLRILEDREPTELESKNDTIRNLNAIVADQGLTIRRQHAQIQKLEKRARYEAYLRAQLRGDVFTG